MRRFILFTTIAFLAFSFSSCKKTEGRGGTSTITGKVHVTEYDQWGTQIAQYDAMEERVYIIYGDNTIHDDETRTGPDGAFKFTFLEQGDYTLFVYTDCQGCDAGKEAIYQFTTISGGKSEVTVPTFEIENR